MGYEFTRFVSTIITVSYIFGGEEGDILGVLTLALTRVSRRLRGRRSARRGGSLKAFLQRSEAVSIG